MMRTSFATTAIAIALLALLSTGCPQRADVAPMDGGTEVQPDEEHDHEQGPPDVHAHDHGEHGPHGGHLVHLDPSGAHAEWVHLDEEEIVRVHVLDSPEEVTGVEMVVEVEGQEPKTYRFERAEEEGPGVYQIQSGELLVAIGMGDAAEVRLQVTSGDQTASTEIEEHDHDH